MFNRVLARNAAAMVVSDVVVRVLTAVGVVLVARSLGPRSYGILSIALAFAGIVGYLSDLGLTHLTLQRVTRPDADVGCILGTIFRIRLALVAAVAALSAVWIMVFYPEPVQRAVMLTVVLPSICGVAMQGFATSYFWATQDLHVAAGLKTASQVLSAAALMAAFLLGWQLRGVAAVYGLTSLLGGAACLWLVRRRVPDMKGWNPGILKGLLSFTVAGVSGNALPQLGPLVMQRVMAATDVGFFAAASRIPAVLYALPGAMGMAWYPYLFRAGSSDAKRHFILSLDQLKLNAILGAGLSLPVALHSRFLIRSILGPAWEPSTAPILSLLCWMVVLNSITTSFADVLTTAGLQARRASAYMVSLGVGAALFYVLASARGAVGGAQAAIITQVLLSAILILINPTGPELLMAAARRIFRPICLASGVVLAVHTLLSETLAAAGISLALFFLVAVVSDFELRTAAKRALSVVSTRWRYA